MNSFKEEKFQFVQTNQEQMQNKVNNSQSDGSYGSGSKKNFLLPSFDGPMIKREQFAVKLRKEKTKALLNTKRKKIMEHQMFQCDPVTFQLGNYLTPEIQLQSQEKQSDLYNLLHGCYLGYPEFNKIDSKTGQNIYQQTLENLNIHIPQSSDVNVINCINEWLGKFNSYDDDLSKLVILTCIRKMLAIPETENDMYQIAQETSIIAYLNEVANEYIKAVKHSSNLEDTSFLRYQALETMWILANLSSSPEEELITWILDKKYKFSQFIGVVLKGNDLHMIENSFYLLSNIMQQSQDYNMIVQRDYKALDCIFTLLLTNKFPMFLLNNALRIMMYFSQNQNLTQQKISTICHLCDCIIDKIDNLQKQVQDQLAVQYREQQEYMNGDEVDRQAYNVTQVNHCHEQKIDELQLSLMKVLKNLMEHGIEHNSTFFGYLIREGSRKILHFVCDRLREIMYHYDASQIRQLKQSQIQLAFEFLGNATSIDEVVLTQFLHDYSIINKISHCMFYVNCDSSIISKAMWVLSNIVVCPQNQDLEQKMVQQVLDDTNLAQKVCKLMVEQTERQIVSEGMWLIVNIIESSSDQQKKLFFDLNSSINDPEKNFVVDEYGTQLYESYTDVQNDDDYENNLIKALMVGIKLLHSVELLNKCLLCIKWLIEMDDLYGLTVYKKDEDQYRESYNSVMEQLRMAQVIKVLEKCRQRHCSGAYDQRELSSKEGQVKEMEKMCDKIIEIMKEHTVRMCHVNEDESYAATNMDGQDEGSNFDALVAQQTYSTSDNQQFQI